MRTIKTYSKGAPFYNALYVQVTASPCFTCLVTALIRPSDGVTNRASIFIFRVFFDSARRGMPAALERTWSTCTTRKATRLGTRWENWVSTPTRRHNKTEGKCNDAPQRTSLFPFGHLAPRDVPGTNKKDSKTHRSTRPCASSA